MMHNRRHLETEAVEQGEAAYVAGVALALADGKTTEEAEVAGKLARNFILSLIARGLA